MNTQLLAAGVLAALLPAALRRCLATRAAGDWQDDPLREYPALTDAEAQLARRLVQGRLGRSDYQQRLEQLAGEEERVHPLLIPASWRI